MISLPRLSLGAPLPPHHLQLALDPGNPILHTAAIGFELSFAFPAAHADAALLAGQVAPETCQPGQQVLKLGQLDLELAFPGLGALRENVEDQRCAVEDFAVEELLEGPALRGGEFVVKDDGIHIRFPAVFRKFVRLAFSNESGGARGCELLHAVADDLGARAGGELCKFFDGFRVVVFAAFNFNAYQKDPLGLSVACLNQCFQSIQFSTSQ